MVSAGHLPPIVVDPDGRARLLDVEGDPPVGAFKAAAFLEREIPIEPGSRILLVTDGAAEVRGEPIDAGLERLRVLAEREPDARRAVRGDRGAARPPAGRATTTSRSSSPRCSRCPTG